MSATVKAGFSEYEGVPNTPPIPRTAVVPAAGLGTRFLPATKTVPKELLPVVDTPGIELVAEEAKAAGAERLLIVTSPGKDGVVAHFVEDLVLENTLATRGKESMLAKVRKAPNLLEVASVVQEKPLGLGHAVGCVESYLDDDEDAVAVLLPDDLVLPGGVLEVMARTRAKRDGTVLCAIEVAPMMVAVTNSRVSQNFRASWAHWACRRSACTRGAPVRVACWQRTPWCSLLVMARLARRCSVRPSLRPCRTTAWPRWSSLAWWLPRS